MQDMEDGGFQKRIETEIRWCMTYEDGGTCKGAGGRKMRQVCVWCANYREGTEENDDRREHGEKSVSGPGR